MFGLQPVHLIIILFIALLVFGPSRLPDLGRAMRRTVDEFRAATQEPAKDTSADASSPREKEAASAKD